MGEIGETGKAQGPAGEWQPAVYQKRLSRRTLLKETFLASAGFVAAMACAKASELIPQKPAVSPTTTAHIVETHGGSEQKPVSNWIVEVDPSVQGKSRWRTIDEDLAIINKNAEKFPQIGNVKVILINGTVSSVTLEDDGWVVERLGRDSFDLSAKDFDEKASIFDVGFNKNLEPYYDAGDFQQLVELRQKIVDKYQDYPSIKKMFAPEKLDKTPQAEFNRRITSYPDSLYVAQNGPIYGPNGEILGRYPLQVRLFDNFLSGDLLAQFSKESQGKINDYANIGEFLDGEKERINKLRASNHFHDLAIKRLLERREYLKNWHWTAGSGLGLDSKRLSQYFTDVLPLYETMALTEAFVSEDPELMRFLTSSERARIKGLYGQLEKAVSNELFARVYGLWLGGQVPMDETVEAYHNLIMKAKSD